MVGPLACTALAVTKSTTTRRPSRVEEILQATERPMTRQTLGRLRHYVHVTATEDDDDPHHHG